MRKIKFRVWSKPNNKMYHQLKESPCFGLFEGDRVVSIEDVFFYEKQDFEVMQYTGLRDKNGKGIYEGDILKGKNYDISKPKEFVGVVEYDWNRFVVKANKLPKYDLNQTLEVIGNIYENSELLNA